MLEIVEIRKPAIRLLCKCGHEWLYSGSRKFYAACPRCRSTVTFIKKKERSQNDPHDKGQSATTIDAAVGGLDTYEAILDNVHFPALGSSKDDAHQSLQSWLDKFTEGYKLRRFYLKKRSAKEEIV